MKQLLQVLVLAILFSGLGAPAEPAELKVLRLDYVVVRESAHAPGGAKREVFPQTRLLAQDGRIRTETLYPDETQRRVEIYDPVRDIFVQLDPKRRTAVRRSAAGGRTREQSLSDPSSLAQAPKAELGTKRIQGFHCQGFRRANDKFEVEHWWCRDRTSGAKFIGSFYARSPAGTWRTELQKVTPEFPVEEEEFQIPGDFEVTDQ